MRRAVRARRVRAFTSGTGGDVLAPRSLHFCACCSTSYRSMPDPRYRVISWYCLYRPTCLTGVLTIGVHFERNIYWERLAAPETFRQGDATFSPA